MFDKRLMRMVPGAMKYVAASVGLQWVALVANIALFVLIGLFVQGVWRDGVGMQGVFVLVLSALMAIAVRMVCQVYAQRMGYEAAREAKRCVRRAVYEKLVRLGPSYRESASTSEAVQVSVEGVEQLEAYFGAYLPQLFYALIASVTLFFALVPLCFPAAVLLLVLVPFIPLSIMLVQRVAKRVTRGYWGSYTDLGSMFLESIQGLATLKIYKADKRRHEDMNAEAEGFRKATMRLLTMQLNSITVMDLFAFGGAAAGIIVMLGQFSAGTVGLAAAVAFLLLAAEFFIPLRMLGSFFHTAMNGMAAAERMYAILDAEEPVFGTKTVRLSCADIVGRGVGYSYDGARTVLEGVDIEVPRGSFIGITGESGSGKSTLAGILSGSHVRYRGSVCIDGVELGEISRESLRETVTYVPFNSYLFEGTVRENLLMANPAATDDELWEVLRHCRLDGFVRESGGLDARVAAEGGNFSGGQRQRFAVARAVLRDTPIYLFDEATSNIDAESEAAIHAFIERLARTKTVIVISHRLAAIRNADEIYVLEGGRLVERGSHGELVERGGFYARLWDRQAQLEEYVQAGVQTAAGSSAAAGDCMSADDRAASGDRAVAHGGAAANGCAVSGDRALGGRRSGTAVMVRLVGLVGPLLPVMALAVLLGVLGFGAAIFLTVFAAFGMQEALGTWSPLSLGAACVLVAVCGVVRGPLRYGEQLCNHYLAFKILALVRDRAFAAMRRLAPAKLEGRGKGDLVSLATSDIELLEVFYAHTLSPAAIALAVSLGMVVFIGAQSVWLAALAAAGYAIVGIAVPLLSSRSMGTVAREVRDAVGSMNGFVLEGLRGLSETLQFGRAADRADELARRTEQLARLERTLKTRTAAWTSLTGALVLLLDVAMLVACTAMTQGTLTLGQALLAFVAFASSFGPVIAVANLGSTLQQTLAAGARVLDLLDEEPQTPEVTSGVDLSGFDGASARGLDFSYGAQRVLSDVNLDIAPGTVLRIAGRSGSGKSTLLKLLMRFWDATSGSVRISGADIRNVNTASLREVEGFMTQETHLFAGTIRDNLLLARPCATDDELRAALGKAALADLIDRLPEGLDAQVGELGASLSGGERQRLGLARVFLHDAPFVLLDEPTSNLDSLSEAAVLRALSRNRADKTIVLVSHRESAAAIADVTYTVERGRLS